MAIDMFAPPTVRRPRCGAVEEALVASPAKGAPVLVHCVTRKGKGFPAAR